MEERVRAKGRYSRLGVIAAILLLLAGLVSVVFGVLPSDWIAQIQAYVADAGNALMSLGDRRIPLGIGVLCLFLGLLMIRRAGAGRNSREQPAAFLNRGVDPGVNGSNERPSEYWVSDWVAPISVYFDLENKPIGGKQVAPFVRYLRQRIQSLTGSDRADLFFYSDAYNSARTRAYQILQQYGFRAIDVPHRRLAGAGSQSSGQAVTTDNLKNFVDFELALHAYQRALHMPQPQWIILISEDTDFIPLIRRLRALGHYVQVWSRSAVPEFKALESVLGIETVVWESELWPEIGTRADFRPSAVTLDKPLQQPSAQKPNIWQSNLRNSQISLPARSLGSVSGQELYEQAVNATLGALDMMGPALNEQVNSLLVLLGYEDAKRYKGRAATAFWLDELKALGVISDNSEGRWSAAKELTASSAASLLYVFVRDDIQEAVHSTQMTSEGAISLSTVCGKVVARTTNLDPEPIRKLRALFRENETNYHLKYTQYFCQCARNLGLVTFHSLTGR